MRDIGSIESACHAAGVPTATIPPDTLGVRVRINGRLRTSLGRYCVRGDKRWIEIHPRVHADPQHFRDTLAHEVAHAIAGIAAGHGSAWKRAARGLGHSGERLVTHHAASRLGIAKRPRRPARVVAVCTSCGAQIKRRKRLPAGEIFTHVHCGGRIEAI